MLKAMKKDEVILVEHKIHKDMFYVKCGDGWISEDFTNKTRASYLKWTLDERYRKYGTFDL